MPNSFLAGNSIYINKFSGYLGFRATQVFRLVVNANPMQQGRYMMYCIYLGGLSTPAVLSAASSVSNTLVQRSQLPHVEIDIACDTEAILRVPFISTLNFFPLAAITTNVGDGAVCRLGIAPYVPLSTGLGSQTCGYTLWSHFEDVELIGPAVPQSGRVFGSTKRRGKNESEVERESASRPISSTLMKISSASAVLSGVPLLSAYAQSVSWVTDILGKAAYSFGWSKPNQIEPAMRMTRSNLPYAGAIDGMDQSQPLSMFTKNSVGKAPGFSGTDIDEMDFLHLAQIPAYRNTTSWSTSDLTASNLLTMQVSPVASIQSRTQNSLQYLDFIPSAFICQYFNYWRGSTVFTFKLVKTDYHSGRLLVAFDPVSTFTNFPAAPNLNSTAYLHREVIDIRDCNEFTFVVPYISCVPYAACNGAINTSSIGRLLVFVLDPLVGPDTVAGTVQIICEQSAGPDFEVAVPHPISFTPGLDLTPQSGAVFNSKTSCSIAETSIGSSGIIKSDDCINAEFCIGEKVTSFRQVMKYSYPLFARLVPLANVSTITVLPYAMVVARNQAVPALPTHLADLYSTLSSCYMLSRGGVRIKTFISSTDTSTYTNVAYLVNGLLTTDFKAIISGVSATYPILKTFAPTAYERHDNSSLEVQVPQYHRYSSRLNASCVASTVYPYDVGTSGVAPNIYLNVQLGAQTPASTLKSVTVLRSMADDGNFGVFRAIPPMLTQQIFQDSS